MTKFVAAELALSIVESLRELMRVLAHHDRDLASQARRAASSVSLNVHEANRREGKDRTYLFSVAAGSAEELRGALRTALAWGYLEKEALAGPFQLIDREVAILYRLRFPRAGASAAR